MVKQDLQVGILQVVEQVVHLQVEVDNARLLQLAV
tara:strand:+ start:497 stop:601 length:105 start_codon:yes stop_codon:yes gene_type:complete